MPKKWEYLHVYRLDKDFNVFSSKGEYLKEEYYRSADPKASWANGLEGGRQRLTQRNS